MISSSTFKILDQPLDSYCISISGTLTGENLNDLRQEVIRSVGLPYDIVYIDTKDVLDTDLSGINELIHSHYQLSNASKQLILVYKANSAIEKWAETTGFDKFITTATLPNS
ncbi:anti-anti-sigma regulatory factor [Pedobacter cryoconitis]|uniref:Anti-anti-sigma regulatory factor n=1 Tax=Pedobacter cryoconitis TaxID=188932 RepID=A0A7W8ZJ32_9SPHI|nr:STAS domain-containing protein [Pedobacter cryoconitis]MBB5634969.1 anti-anti-sigma regulatory factor [Pedobacter cryoconitis]